MSDGEDPVSRSLITRVADVQTLLRERLWLQVLVGMALGIGLHSPDIAAAADEVAATADEDPAAALDDFFAGQTVADREFGMKLIRERGAKVPKVGQEAPDFELMTADGEQSFRLSSFQGKRPVVLIFGSHT